MLEVGLLEHEILVYHLEGARGTPYTLEKQWAEAKWLRFLGELTISISAGCALLHCILPTKFRII